MQLLAAKAAVEARRAAAARASQPLLHLAASGPTLRTPLPQRPQLQQLQMGAAHYYQSAHECLKAAPRHQPLLPCPQAAATPLRSESVVLHAIWKRLEALCTIHS